jgi:hypothetical protein
MTSIERLPSASYAAQKDLPYADVWNLHGLFDGLAFKSNLILVVAGIAFLSGQI